MRVKVAAIDCGTNSVRLLIAQVGSDSSYTDVLRCMRIVRLGHKVDETGMLAPEALQRVYGVAREYAALLKEHGVPAANVRCVATSAVRDAGNKQEFLNGMREILDVQPEIIGGAQEAQLSFAGAVRVFGPGRRDVDGILVMDLGGGSTEFVAGSVRRGAGNVTAAVSINLGCVRMSERFIVSDPPTTTQADALRAAVAQEMDKVAQVIDFEKVERCVGVAGTITTITAAVLKLDRYDRERINGTAVSMDDIIDVTNKLSEMKRQQRAGLGYMHPGRNDVISAGALVYQEIVRKILDYGHGKVDAIITSEYDILDGIALSIAL